MVEGKTLLVLFLRIQQESRSQPFCNARGPQSTHAATLVQQSRVGLRAARQVYMEAFSLLTASRSWVLFCIVALSARGEDFASPREAHTMGMSHNREAPLEICTCRTT